MLATYDTDAVPCRGGGLGDLSALDAPLFVVHAKPRQEKVLAWELGRLGFGYFLPLIDRVRLSGRKRYVAREPVFPQYLFVVGDAETDARETQAEVCGLPSDRIIRTIAVPPAGQYRLRCELHAIDVALNSNQRIIDTVPYAVPGRVVQIAAGPLMGLRGKVMHRRDRQSQTSVLLTVEMMGNKGIEVEIPAEFLEAA